MYSYLFWLILKLFSLVWLLIGIRRKSFKFTKQNTLLYRGLCSIGRWSMLDIFMISILGALVNLGIVANIIASPGAIAFATAVVLTILAVNCFDPRLMWNKSPTQ